MSWLGGCGLALQAVCARRACFSDTDNVCGASCFFNRTPTAGCHRAELEPHIGEVCTASVACGVMGYGGNKGAAAVSFSLFRRRVVLVSSHFAAHQVRVCWEGALWLQRPVQRCW